MVLGDKDLICYAVDSDAALLQVNGQKFVLDYSTLMDLIWNLAKVATELEKRPAVPVEQQNLQ